MWDPNIYLKFEQERKRPALDLLGAIPREFSPGLVLDIGAGAGNITKLLLEKFPQAHLTALESDPNMVEKLENLGDRIQVLAQDMEDFSAGPEFDLVFANASLHWAEDALGELGRWASWVKEGGCLAVQLPDNFDQPTHLLIREVMEKRPELRDIKDLLPRAHDLNAAAIFDCLKLAGLQADIWHTRYYHFLQGEHPVLDWVCGTTLRPVLGQLETQPELKASFLKDLSAAFEEGFEKVAGGVVLMPFLRLFIVAWRV